MGAIPLQPLRHEEIEYPDSDGRPMAESTLHRKVMSDLIEALEQRYEADPNVWVGGNLLLYYEEGNPRASISPDVLVAPVPKWDRPIYKLWEEGSPPGFVIEVTSSTTRREDLGKKKDLYERLGIEEYILFDPLGDYLRPRLQGYRLQAGRYVQMSAQADGALQSRFTGLILRPEGTNLRLVDARTGERLPWNQERAEALRSARQRARALEEEVARLQDELARARRESGTA